MLHDTPLCSAERGRFAKRIRGESEPMICSKLQNKKFPVVSFIQQAVDNCSVAIINLFIFVYTLTLSSV